MKIWPKYWDKTKQKIGVGGFVLTLMGSVKSTEKKKLNTRDGERSWRIQQKLLKLYFKCFINYCTDSCIKKKLNKNLKTKIQKSEISLNLCSPLHI